MQQSSDSPNSHDQSVNRRVTVAEAAQLLGVSTDSIRSRLRRGTLKREDASDGTILVVLPSDSSDTDSQPTVSTGHSTNHPTVEYVELLHSNIARLERELEIREEEARRKDHLLAAALERIPAIEAPAEPREARDTASESADKGDVPPEPQEPVQRRSWLSRFFFGP
jgi:hypothetical protein